MIGKNSMKHDYTWISITTSLKVKLKLLTGIDVRLMVEKGIRGGICNAIH